MRIETVLDILRHIQAKDAVFLDEIKETGSATFCCECKQNEPVRRRPFWHRFARRICPDCAPEYVELLKALGADDLLA